jgi:hypothetical protein
MQVPFFHRGCSLTPGHPKTTEPEPGRAGHPAAVNGWLHSSTLAIILRPRQLAQRYSDNAGTGASGWDARAERSMAMAA